MDREKILQEITATQKIDVLIIGGGINGAGTFLDLALNNVNVLIVDRADFCSGTSSASSHMAHGGIRYLENGEFRLVREAVAERNRMIENAPHMVKPLPTVIPIFKFWSGLLNAPLKFINLLDRPSERGALIIKLGLMMYDAYTKKQKTVPTHKFYRRNEALKRFPQLNKDVKYSALYYDGQIVSPERLNVEIILDAEKQGIHAKALNYVSVERMEGKLVVLKDQVTGVEYRVDAGTIVNASGPWVDDVNGRLGVKTKYIGGTKGSHIIVDNKELRQAIGNKEFFFENKDGRIVLLFPFYDKVIVGTSDLPLDNPDDARCTIEEEDYFIHLVDRVFPEIKIQKEQIVFRFSGVRPLEYQHAKTTGQITRDHSIQMDNVNGNEVLSLIGGKWTSYRAFSEQISDKILSKLDKARVLDTKNFKIGGGKGYPTTSEGISEWIGIIAQKYKLNSEYVSEKFDQYGLVAEEIFASSKTKDHELLTNMNSISKNEITFLVKNEKVVHLDDLLLRRTNIGWLGKLNMNSLQEIGEIVGKELEWPSEIIKKEIERTQKTFFENNGVIL